MSVSGEYVDNFQSQVAEPADHYYANWINFFHHGLTADSFEGDVLAEAIKQADVELAPGLANAEAVGYSAARNALRWLEYKRGYLSGIDTDRAWKPHLIADAWKDQTDSELAVAHSDVAYLGLFDWLERDRVLRLLQALPQPDPIDHERAYASGVAANEIDRLLMEESEVSDYGDFSESRKLKLVVNEVSYDCYIERFRDEMSLNYKARLSRAITGTSTRGQTSRSRDTYDFKDHLKGMVAYQTNEKVTSRRATTKGLLSLARKLSRGQELVFDRLFVNHDLVTRKPRPKVS